MAFRKKAYLMQVERPDILIIPECEHPDKFIGLDFLPTSSVWHGFNKNKGLGVFSFGDYSLKLLDGHDEGIEIVCPISVSVGNLQFFLLAVWAQQTNDWDYRHIGQVWKSVYHYEKLLAEHSCIVIGDFNSNVMWDKNHRIASHTMTVNKLKELRINSAYHNYFAVEHGKENHPTFYLYRHESRPYHIDYCFLSEYFSERLTEVSIGAYDTWKAYSDHTPLIITIDI